MNIGKQLTKAATVAGLMILTALPALAQVRQAQYGYHDYTYHRTTVTPYHSYSYSYSTREYHHHRRFHKDYNDRYYYNGRYYNGRYYNNGSWRYY